MVDEPSSDATWPAPPWAAPSAVADEQKAVASQWPAPPPEQFPAPIDAMPKVAVVAQFAPQYDPNLGPAVPWRQPPPVWQPSFALYRGYTSLYAGDDATGRLPLRPMKVTEIVDATFKLLRGRFWSLVVAAIAIAVPLGMFRVWASQTFQRDEYLQTFAFTTEGNLQTLTSARKTPSYFGLLTGYVAVVVGSLGLTVVLSRVVSDAYHAKKTKLRGAWKATTSRWVVAFGVITVAMLPFWVALGVLVLAGPNDTSSPLVILVGILLVTNFLFISPRLYPLIPVVSLENHGVRASIKRTFVLTKKSAARIFGLSIVLGLASFAVGLALALPFTGLLSLLKPATVAYQAVSVFSTVVASAVQLPLLAIAATLSYFDLRIRNEGYDLEVIAKTLQEHDEMAS